MGLLDRIRNKGAPSTRAEADELVLRQLQARGADLAKPRHVIHFLYFSDEGAATRAADVIERAGYETQVAAPNERQREWVVRSEAYRVVGPTTVAGFRAWFEHIAEENGGEYDGWEAAAKP